MNEETTVKIRNTNETILSLQPSVHSGGYRQLVGQIACDGFILPNKATCLDDFVTVPDTKILALSRIALSNKLPFNILNDKIIDMQFSSCRDENMVDHGFHYYLENEGELSIFFKIGIMPAKMFRGKREGEITTFKLSNQIIKINWLETKSSENVQANLTFNVCLNQASSKHNSFGSFEELYQKLTMI
jgi:hypothetical protein